MALALHRSRAELVGSAYIEFLPGRFRGVVWGPGSVFLDEEAFGFVRPAIERLCPKYDYYAYTAIEAALWHSIVLEWEDLAAFLATSPRDAALAARLNFPFPDTEGRFFERREESVARLQAMLGELMAWVRVELEEHSVITLLGL